MSKKELNRKHREEQEATAYAFQEFIKTFQDATGPPHKTFVKSGILNAKAGQENDAEKGQIYNPQPFLKPTSNSTIRNAIECARLLKENKVDRKGHEKPKSNLELLKEELKLRHMERGERSKAKDELALYSTTMGTASNADPNTTNIFIANVSPKVTEQDLMQLFGAYGPLGSVKIMWPRCEDKSRASNCGFVAFMSRSDAERAMQGLKDREDMRIGWGKAVELPTNPVYIPPELLKLSLPPPCSGLPFNAQPLKQPFKNPTTEQEMEELLCNSVIKVTIPLDKKILMTVHRMIEFVIREGPLFEAMVMNQEINNPTYQFLFDNRNPVHIYYRWKLYSLLHGGNKKGWSTKEFRMFKSGSIWQPPVIPDYTKGMPAHLVEPGQVDKTMLSDAQKTRFIQLIQSLNLTKKRIGEAMVFCLNHVDAVRDVVDVIIDSFASESTKATRKVARLYLLSDVLYNSSMKKCYAPIYRIEFEKHLVNIFRSLHCTYIGLTADTDREAFKSKVMSVLRSWDLWKIYPNDFLNSLENTFLGINSENEFDDDSDNEPLDGANLIKRSLKNGAAEYVVKDEAKQKPLEKAAKKPELLPGFIPSKWETVDPEQVEAQAMSTKKFYDLEMERQLQEKKKRKEAEQGAANKKVSEQEREMLRKVEVMVMQHQDEFENGKRRLKKGKSLEKELSCYRARLLEKIRRESESNKSRRCVSPVSPGSFSDEEPNRNEHSKHKKVRKHSLVKEKDRKRSYRL